MKFQTWLKVPLCTDLFKFQLVKTPYIEIKKTPNGLPKYPTFSSNRVNKQKRGLAYITLTRYRSWDQRQIIECDYSQPKLPS